MDKEFLDQVARTAGQLLTGTDKEAVDSAVEALAHQYDLVPADATSASDRVTRENSVEYLSKRVAALVKSGDVKPLDDGTDADDVVDLDEVFGVDDDVEASANDDVEWETGNDDGGEEDYEFDYAEIAELGRKAREAESR